MVQCFDNMQIGAHCCMQCERNNLQLQQAILSGLPAILLCCSRRPMCVQVKALSLSNTCSKSRSAASVRCTHGRKHTVPDVWAYQFRVLFANAEHKAVSGTAPPWLARMSQLDDTQHTKHVQTIVSMIVQQVLHSRHRIAVINHHKLSIGLQGSYMLGLFVLSMAMKKFPLGTLGIYQTLATAHLAIFP